MVCTYGASPTGSLNAPGLSFRANASGARLLLHREAPPAGRSEALGPSLVEVRERGLRPFSPPALREAADEFLPLAARAALGFERAFRVVGLQFDEEFRRVEPRRRDE